MTNEPGIRRRFSVHRCTLRKGVHRNAHLQHSWDKYGEKEFVFQVLEVCDVESLTKRERFHLWVVREEAFNIAAPGPTSRAGKKMSDETKAKIRAAKLASGSLQLVTIDGVTASASAHAEARGVASELLSYRRRRGMNLIEAILTPPRKAQEFNAFGRTAPLKELCQEFGIDPEVARQRIKMGWSVEDAISRPNHRAA